MKRQASGSGASVPAHPFVFLGGDIALDFVNTVMVEDRRLVDRVSSPDELAVWVAMSELGTQFGTPAAISTELHARVIRLRGALKTSFDALSAGEPIPDEPMSVVNDALRSSPGSELYRALPGVLARRPCVDLVRDVSMLPWVLADAGANLMVSKRATRLRRCANHDTCVLVFLDTSRSRTRRWCSMDLCGNRSKVAAHDARVRRRRAGEGS